ncbi:MAG TPA: DNA repair protein RadC [Candidatus Cryptobacteroides merdipullorum]|uniref:DNA repair protein RadC n=1 Tax=Candidatus Cryptobacteroides merdipullorum TaxID=2840771 RepID=A0A9D1GNU1_9BACT|nr:DNA repair protein RadC [Candidatus Cryptobacteroides merdipullorum]
MKIKDLCASERPREKLLAEGAGRLSNGELLAVLLRSGMRNLSAVELAQQLLNACDAKLCNLLNMDCGRLCAIPGIGKDKAATVMAALELGRRFLHEESAFDRKAIVTARSVFEIMLPRLKGLRHEECWMLLLNDSCYLIKCVMLSSGGGRATVIDARQVLRLALDNCASGIILVHNHPSGNPRPSEADKKQTAQLHKAAVACGLQLMDHVVVCDDCFFSFAEERVAGIV